MSSIVTVTVNPAVDKSTATKHVVADRKLRCSDPEYDPGGGGINVARTVWRLGGEAKAFWSCGGLTGQMLGDLLDREGVSHEPVPIAGTTRENLTVLEESSGRQYRFGMPGPRLSQGELNDWENRMARLDPAPDYLVLSGSLPPDCDDAFYARLARRVNGSCRVVLDASGAALLRGLETPVYLIKPNLRELGELAGRPAVHTDDEIAQVSRQLVLEGKVRVVVTSLGSGGVVLTTASQVMHIRAPTVPIRSRVGAGDSMVGGIVLALSRGMPLQEAVRFGVAAGAAAVMTDGTELCRREDVERLFAKMQSKEIENG